MSVPILVYGILTAAGLFLWFLTRDASPSCLIMSIPGSWLGKRPPPLRAGSFTWGRQDSTGLYLERHPYAYWGAATPPSFCFVSRSRITRTEGHFPYLVSHRQVLGGVWRNVKMCCAHSQILCPTLCDPMDCSLTGSSVHGILQARILEWVAIFFSRGFSQPRAQTHISQVSWTGRWLLYHWHHLRSPYKYTGCLHN